VGPGLTSSNPYILGSSNNACRSKFELPLFDPASSTSPSTAGVEVEVDDRRLLVRFFFESTRSNFHNANLIKIACSSGEKKLG
jgi:hypothetical protein